MTLCPSCDTECLKDAKFCHNCGQSLLSKFGDNLSEQKSSSLINSRNNLERLMPKEYVDRLLRSKGKMEGERRVVTILFSDVKGSTSLAEDLDPEEVLEIMNGAFEMLIKPITRYGGTLARLMGDAILAFFGAPIAHDDDPYLACRAALDILDGAKIYSEKLQKDRGIEGFAVRVGINTGLVVVAEVGADLRVEYTAMGDAVNIAARMESTAEPNTVLITEATKKLVEDKFNLKSMGPISVKGKANPLNVFRLINLKLDQLSLKNETSSESKLIGRNKELSEIKKNLKILSNGTGKIISIIGEQGVGKSRIVREARKLSPQHYKWVEGRAFAYTQKDSYWLAREVLNSLFEIKGDSILAPEEKIKSFLAMLNKEKFDDIYPFLTHFLNINLEDNIIEPVDQQDAETLKGQIHFAYKEFIKNNSLTQPLVIVLEDLHWGDSTSIELFEEFYTLVEEYPILFILIFRNNHGEVWNQLNNTLQSQKNFYIPLAILPLSKKESSLMINSLIVNKNIPSEFKSKIVDKTEGNPFFIEELVHSFFDKKIIDSDNTNFDMSLISKDFEIPNLLHSVILSRVDHLTPLDKSILQTASVIGKKIPKQLLSEILNEYVDHDEFENELRELSRKNFISRLLPLDENSDLFSEEGDYIFKSSLTQDVVYDTLLQSHRRKLHNKIGVAIEKLYPISKNEHGSILAYHYEKGENWEKAVYYYNIAGNRSKDIFANDEAIYSYLNVIELSKKYELSDSKIFDVHEALGDIYTLTSDYESAIDQYLIILEADIDNYTSSNILYKCAKVYERRGMYNDALKYFEKSFEKIDEISEIKLAALIYSGIGMVHYRQENLEKANEYNIKALKILEENSEITHVADVYNNLGIICCKENKGEEALKYHLKCYQIKKKLGNVAGLAASNNNMGYLYQQTGDYNRAIEYYQQSLILCEKTGNLHGLAKVYDNISHVYLYQNENEKAQEYNVKAIVTLGKVALKGNEVSHDIWLQSGVW